MLESIEKMREWAQKYGPMGSHDPLAFADEIEREIAERYMLLPVDADGVPIRVGDELKDANGVKVIVECVSSECFYANGTRRNGWCNYRHAKPRTVEDVLQERIGDVLSVMAVGEPVPLEAILNDSFGKECADELRELLGGDAE